MFAYRFGLRDLVNTQRFACDQRSEDEAASLIVFQHHRARGDLLLDALQGHSAGIQQSSEFAVFGIQFADDLGELTFVLARFSIELTDTLGRIRFGLLLSPARLLDRQTRLFAESALTCRNVAIRFGFAYE